MVAEWLLRSDPGSDPGSDTRSDTRSDPGYDIRYPTSDPCRGSGGLGVSSCSLCFLVDQLSMCESRTDCLICSSFARVCQKEYDSCPSRDWETEEGQNGIRLLPEMHPESWLWFLQMEGESNTILLFIMWFWAWDVLLSTYLKIYTFKLFRPTRRQARGSVTWCRSNSFQRRPGGLDPEVVET